MHVFQAVRGIRAKATLLVLLLLTLTMLISYFITVRIMNNHILGEIIKRAESLDRGIASSAGYNLTSQDLLGLDNMVYKIKTSNPDIEYIAILGPERNIIVHSDIKNAGGLMAPSKGRVLESGAEGTLVHEISGALEVFYEIETPVVFMNKNLGSVVLRINRSVLSDAQKESRRKVVGVFAAILALGMIASVLLSSNLTRPVKELLSGVEELKRGKRGKPLQVYSKDELGRLTTSFNEMTDLITAQQDKLSKFAYDLEQAYVSTIRVLGAAIDARDHYTLGHSTRVSELAVALAKDVGLSGSEVEAVEIACLFHDVGKIRIPDSILHKQGSLNVRERDEMRKHAEYGAELLSKAPSLCRYIPAVRHHHEWYNGDGYPDRLSGNQIPVAAAIISLADVYDAMTSDRPYRTAMGHDEALAKIAESAGRQFSPELVTVFLKTMEKRTGPVSAGAAPGSEG